MINITQGNTETVLKWIRFTALPNRITLVFEPEPKP
jgi:hypothetical protein